MSLRFFVYLPLVIVIFLGFVACGMPEYLPENSDQDADDISQFDPVPVEIKRVQTGSIAEFLETTGNIYADSRVIVYPKASGQIMQIRVEEGDTVSENQILAVIDDDELRLRTQQLETALRQAREKRDRTRELFENRMISREAYDDAMYRYEDADITFRLARLNLENTRIKSPVNGVVVSRKIRIGDLVSAATPTFDIIDPQSLLVDVYLPERDVMRLQVGMPAMILPDSLPEQSFPASIQRINPAIDPSTGTVKVTLQFESGLEHLNTGMFVRVRIKIESREDAVILPKRALVRHRDENRVFVVNTDNVAEQRTVMLGLENMHSFEVLAGLEDNEILIVVGQHSIEDGQPVRWNDNSRSVTSSPIDTEMD